MTQFEKTNAQFEQALAECRALFEKKLHDYKASWRILRPSALTDQLFIKAKRIRSLEITHHRHRTTLRPWWIYSPFLAG